MSSGHPAPGTYGIGVKHFSTPVFSTRRWVAVSILVSIPSIGQTQRAGLWETQMSVAGNMVGRPIQTCVAADAPLQALSLRPAHCRAGGLRRTPTGHVSELRCRTGQPGTMLSLRRTISGDLNQQYVISTEAQIIGANGASSPPQRTVGTNRYLGSCTPAGGYAVTNLEQPSKGPSAIAGSLLIVGLQLMAFAGTAYGMFCGLAWLSRRLGRRGYERATVENISVDSTGAATIPVLATFTGVRSLPWWYAVAMNNAKPLLVIEPDGISFRVLQLRQRRYAEIDCVDVRQATGTVNLDFTFQGSLLTFSANLGAMPLAAHVLSLLPASVPLSARARATKAHNA
jgi:hypothetical protein